MNTLDALLGAIEIIERSGVMDHDKQAVEIVNKLEELVASYARTPDPVDD